MRRGLVLLLVLSGASACLFPSLGILEGSSNDASVESGTDATPGDASLPPGWVLVAAEDFEDAGCGPFHSSSGNVSTVTTAHGGTNACQTCYTSGAYFTLDPGSDYFLLPVLVGDKFAARAWVRAGPQTTNVIRGQLNQRFMDDGGYLTSKNGLSTVLGSTFQQIENSPLVSVSNNYGVNVYVEGTDVDAGDCFIVDDVAVYRIP